MTGILMLILKETFLSLIGRIAFKAIAERAITRVVVKGLKKLSTMTGNDVTDDIVKDILASLEGKKLKAL